MTNFEEQNQGLPQLNLHERQTLDPETARETSARRIRTATGNSTHCPTCGGWIEEGDETEVHGMALFHVGCLPSRTRTVQNNPFAGHDVGCAVASGVACDCR